MLHSLKIENYVLIESLSLDFNSGFSVFTGETGAGKSILIDAIGIIGGDRFTTDLIRHGQDKAYIEAVFETHNTNVEKLCESFGIELHEDPLIISRELKMDGKSSSRINGKSVPVSLLKEIGIFLVDIHSQHDTQYLLNMKHHLSLLDAFQPSHLIFDVKEAYRNFKVLSDELDEKMNHELNPDELEFLSYQVKEIEDAKLEIGEDSLLEEKLKAMMSYEKNNSHLNSAISALDEGDNVAIRIHEALRHLNVLENSDQAKLIADQLHNFYYEYNELFFSIQALQSEIIFDEFEINRIQERLFLLSKLKKKFGNTLEKIVLEKDKLNERIELIVNRHDVIEKLEAEKKRLYADFIQKATELSMSRKKRAIELESAVLHHIRDLYLEKSQFKIEFIKTEGNQSGIDQVEFLISMNPGEPLRPLIKVASGGELSRLMLGLKVVFNHLQLIETVIFDEIDAGVSGRVASAIGEKMVQMSEYAQVFSVTHLAQVAAYGKNHYVVSKLQSDNHTQTQIKALDHTSRVEEISTILSGVHTESSLKAAEELLIRAKQTHD